MAYYLVDGWVDLLVWNEVDATAERMDALRVSQMADLLALWMAS